MNHKDHGQRSTVTSNPLGSNNSTYRRGFPATTPMSSHDHRSTYSFDVLKPHPLTANLMNAMTSPNTTSLSGSATVGGGLSSARGDSHVESTVLSVQKARPTFRVRLPPSPPSEHGTPERFGFTEGGEITKLPRCSLMQLPFSCFPGDASQQLRGVHHTFEPTHSMTTDAADDKKHCCPHCDKRFNRPSSLNIHVNTHTGAKRSHFFPLNQLGGCVNECPTAFQCPFPGCSRRFNVNSNMRRHYRNHISTRRRDPSVHHLAELDKVYPPFGGSFARSPPSPFLSSPLNRSYMSRSRSSSLSALDEEEEHGDHGILGNNGTNIQGTSGYRINKGLSPSITPQTSRGVSTRRFSPQAVDYSQENALQMLANVTERFQHTNTNTRC